MGCDIHLYVEKKDGDRWVTADKWSPNEYYDADEPEGERPVIVDYDNRIYTGRNYDLFAILADVRNGLGFAGMVTGGRFTPIAMPKGLPDDVSPEVKAESDGWNSDGHSHSYFTLAELEAYDWATPINMHEGWVDPWNFDIWRKTGKPSSWSGGVSGGKVEHISNRQMATMLDTGDIEWSGDPQYGSRAYTTAFARKMQTVDFQAGTVGDSIAQGNSYYTLVEWTEPYATSVGEWLTETMPRLREMANGDSESLRIVFWFDN